MREPVQQPDVFRSHDEWLEEAFLTEASKEFNKTAISGILVGVVVWGLSGNWMAGTALGGLGLYYSDKACRRSNRALQAIQANRIAAPFLKGDDFKAYRLQFGDEEVLRQTRFAYEWEHPLTGEADEYLHTKLPNLKPTDVAKANQPPAIALAPHLVTPQMAALPTLIHPSNTTTTTTVAGDGAQPLHALFQHFRYAPVAVIGAQGSGKSTVLKLIAQWKQADGQQVQVLNTHAMPKDWEGFEIIGAGHDYAAVEAFLDWYPTEIKHRYSEGAQSGLTADQFRDQLAAAGRAMTFVCDEQTNWSGNVNPEKLHTFSLSSLTESRKVLLPPVFGLHGDKLVDYGLKNGAERKDAALVKLLLDKGIPDPITGHTISTGKGTLRLPDGTEFRFQFEKPVALSSPAVPHPETQQWEQIVSWLAEVRQGIRRAVGAIEDEPAPAVEEGAIGRSPAQPGAIDPAQTEDERFPPPSKSRFDSQFQPVPAESFQMTESICQRTVTYLRNKNGISVYKAKQSLRKLIKVNGNELKAEQIDALLALLQEKKLIEIHPGAGTQKEYIKVL